ncbi:MAG: SsrA-binding protein SmpB [Gammaproteobacteria bacterium]
MNKQNTTSNQRVITVNRKARHDYFIEKQFEAGLVLEGWEVKGLRAGGVQLKDSYVLIKQGAAWLLNAHISPPKTVSTHIHPEPERTRKLLLHQRELDFLAGAVQQEGYTLVPLDLHWKNNRAKVEFGLAKGKKLYDKRESDKQRDWQREKARVLRQR